MTKIEMIQSRIMERMQDILSNEQLQHLENVLAIEFHGIEVQEECTQLVTSEIHWQKILRTFIASKRIENCSPGTLERYNDCVVKLVTALNKRLQDITTNDIRYYLAMYQEQRKIAGFKISADTISHQSTTKPESGIGQTYYDTYFSSRDKRLTFRKGPGTSDYMTFGIKGLRTSSWKCLDLISDADVESGDFSSGNHHSLERV